MRPARPPAPSRQPRRLPGAAKTPAWVCLTAPPACRAGPDVTAAGPGGPALPGRVAVRARLRPEGSERVRHGAADRFVASVPVKLLLITDTDAPHSVVAVAEKIEEVRLRRASGSREWLGPVRWCGVRRGWPARGAGHGGESRRYLAWIPWEVSPERPDSHASQLTYRPSPNRAVAPHRDFAVKEAIMWVDVTSSITFGRRSGHG